MLDRVIYLAHRLFWHYLMPCEKEARHLGVKIGESCLIATRKWSSEPYLITIGNHVQITEDVSFFTHGGGNCIRQHHPNFDVFGKIVIKDWAYIGARSCIMPGVTVGEGALVAASSVVAKSVPPHMVVAGNPARIVCTTDEFYEKNKQFDMNKRLTGAAKKSFLLQLPDSKFIQK